MAGIFEAKRNRAIALVVLLVFGGIALPVINWFVGYTDEGNPPVAIVGHVVGVMLWGFACGMATRWVRL